MKIKATKVMAKEITKNTGFSASLVKLTPDEFTRFVTIYPWREERDFDSKTYKYSVIRIEYPGEFYANPLYLTTRDLTTVFRNSDRTYDGFFKHLKDSLEI